MIKNTIKYLVISSLAFFITCKNNEIDPLMKHSTTLYKAGDYNYHSFRIPALLLTEKGTILAFCEARKNHPYKDGDIDIVLRRSTDEGKTWKKMVVIHEDGENAIGNPVPFQNRSTGRIWLIFCKNNIEIFSMYSDNEGKNWSNPKNISEKINPKDWTWVGTGPGHGLQLSSGRFIIPSYHRSSMEPGTFKSHIIYSDDFGNSWEIGGILGENTSECTALELVDKSVYLNMRSHDKENKRAVARSFDSGLSWTQTTLDNQLVDPECQGSILRLSDSLNSDKNRILFTNPASLTRERLTVKISYDEGKSWVKEKIIYSGLSSYSDLAIDKNSQIYCLFEKEYVTIELVKFDLSWITDGEDSFVMAK